MGEYYALLLKKRREEEMAAFPERPEGDFTTARPVPRKGMTTCDNCDSLLKQTEAMVVTKHIGRSTKQFHFCGEVCANHYYLEQLRSGL